MTLKKTMGLAIVSTVLLVGCKSPVQQAVENSIEKNIEAKTGGQADVDLNGNSMTIKTKDGTMTTGNKVPADWPTDVPTYANGTITWSASAMPDNDKPGKAMMFSTSDDGATVFAFYKTSLTAAGWTVKNEMQSTGMSVLTAEKDGRKAAVSMMTAQEMTNVTLSVEDAE